VKIDELKLNYYSYFYAGKNWWIDVEKSGNCIW